MGVYLNVFICFKEVFLSSPQRRVVFIKLLYRLAEIGGVSNETNIFQIEN